MTDERSFFRKCTTCRNEIGFGRGYYRCSVSTCNRKRLTLVFCSVPCWESHLADARHRDAWAESDTAPTKSEWETERAREATKADRRSGSNPIVVRGARGREGHEVLIVVAKLKDYIRDRAGMSTSDRVFGLLSDHVRDVVDRAAQAASTDGRKTILDRDVRPLFARELRSLATGETSTDSEGDTLVVVSKLKRYVKTSTGMNTSDTIVPILSGHLRYVCREAIKSAGRNDRRTVMVQDFAASIED